MVEDGLGAFVAGSGFCGKFVQGGVKVAGLVGVGDDLVEGEGLQCVFQGVTSVFVRNFYGDCSRVLGGCQWGLRRGGTAKRGKDAKGAKGGPRKGGKTRRARKGSGL